jgi:hypothetical protein
MRRLISWFGILSVGVVLSGLLCPLKALADEVLFLTVRCGEIFALPGSVGSGDASITFTGTSGVVGSCAVESQGIGSHVYFPADGSGATCRGIATQLAEGAARFKCTSTPINSSTGGNFVLFSFDSVCTGRRSRMVLVVSDLSETLLHAVPPAAP